MRRKSTKVKKVEEVMRSTKHIPQRTCIACRQSKNKRDLIRLVCTSNLIEVDLQGKKPGRGVYLCPRSSCWEKGLKGNRLEHSLRTRLSAENRQMLLAIGKGLIEKENP